VQKTEQRETNKTGYEGVPSLRSVPRLVPIANALPQTFHNLFDLAVIQIPQKCMLLAQQCPAFT